VVQRGIHRTVHIRRQELAPKVASTVQLLLTEEEVLIIQLTTSLAQEALVVPRVVERRTRLAMSE